MKMEVLSVQNHIQGQFGAIGSATKVKDWTSPLTAPVTVGSATAAAAVPTSAANILTEAQYLDADVDVVDGHRSSVLVGSVTAAAAVPTSAANIPIERQYLNADVDVDVDADAFSGVDVVDGHPSSVLHMLQHQALNTRPLVAAAAVPRPMPMPALKQTPIVTAANFDASAAHVNGGNAAAAYPHHVCMRNVLSSTGTGPVATPASPTRSTAAVMQQPASPLQSTAGARLGAADNMDDVSASAVHELSQRLQAMLRAAKSRHLACTEVTLPSDLTQRIAAEIIRMSEREPCGERACTIFIEFESEPNNKRRIASFKVDPDTVSIFELYLTLKQDKSGWTSFVPQFIKNLTRSNTIMISPDFTLTKNKLYSSD